MKGGTRLGPSLHPPWAMQETMPEVPEPLAGGLKTARSGRHPRWTPRAKVPPKGEGDIYGNVREEPACGPRWELWDSDPEGGEYKVMTLQGPDPDREFREPGEWLLELVRLFDPARYGGDVGRMVRAMVDDPNRRALEVAEEDFEDLVDQAVRWYFWAHQPKAMVPADIQ